MIILLLRAGAKDCWEVAGIRVEQEEDGLVRVERLNRREHFSIYSLSLPLFCLQGRYLGGEDQSY